MPQSVHDEGHSPAKTPSKQSHATRLTKSKRRDYAVEAGLDSFLPLPPSWGTIRSFPENVRLHVHFKTRDIVGTTLRALDEL